MKVRVESCAIECYGGDKETMGAKTRGYARLLKSPYERAFDLGIVGINLTGRSNNIYFRRGFTLTINLIGVPGQ